MGSQDSASDRRKSVRQVRSTKKRVESGKRKDGESPVQVSGKESQLVGTEEINSQQISPTSSYGWQHPAELHYITPDDWSDTKIIYHLIAYAFDIPPKSSKHGHSFCQIVRMDGTKTVLPHGYRLPLMFLARFQWDSLNLVLSASNRRVEWTEYKFGILHISRLCKVLLDSAQAALGTIDWVSESVPSAKSKNAIRRWRCPTFDRALVRYWFRWFISNPDEVKEFWMEYGETEYEKDVIALNWRQWALKGHRGFSLAEEEIQNGISAQQIMQGLEEKDGKWHWSTPTIDGGTDAWSLKAKALAAMTSFDNTPNPNPPTVSYQTLSSKTSPSIIPSLDSTPNPPSISCRPPSSITSPSVANILSSSDKPPGASLTPDVHQPQSPSTSTPVPTLNSTTSLDDNIQSHVVRLPTDTTHNSDPDPSGTTAQVAPDSGDDARSAGGKRPGSPLEKEGPAKRPMRSSISRVDCTTEEISHPEQISELVSPPFTPIIPYSPIQRERELKSMDLDLCSQRSGRSVVDDDDDDDDMSIDSNLPLEEPTQPSSISVERPTSNVLSPRLTGGMPSIVLPSPPMSSPMISVSRPASPSQTTSNPLQQIPPPPSVQLSPISIAPTPKSSEDTESSNTQWQQPYHENESNSNSYTTTQSLVANEISNTPGPPGPSTRRETATNPSGIFGPIEFPSPSMLEDMLRKVAIETKDAVNDVIRSKFESGISAMNNRVEMQSSRVQSGGSGLNVGDVRREVLSCLDELESRLERKLQAYLESRVADMVMSATREELGRVLGDAGTARNPSFNGVLNGGEDVDGSEKGFSKDREREQHPGELESKRERLPSSGETANKGKGPVGVVASSSNLAESSSLLPGHPLAHLVCNETDLDETDTSFDGRIPRPTYDDPHGQNVTPLHRGHSCTCSWNQTPSMDSDVASEPRPVEQRYDIPEAESPETAVATCSRFPSSTFSEDDIVNVTTPLLPFDGETTTFTPNASSIAMEVATSFSIFPSPIPARSHRKLNKLGGMSG